MTEKICYISNFWWSLRMWNYKGCFDYFLSLWGFGAFYTWPHQSELKTLSLSLGGVTVALIVFILYLQCAAVKKHFQINRFFEKIKDDEFVKLYSRIPHQIVYLCQLTLLFQLVAYILIAISLFSLEHYTERFGSTEYDPFGINQFFIIGRIEKAIIWSAVVPTSLWLTIFML